MREMEYWKRWSVLTRKDKITNEEIGRDLEVKIYRTLKRKRSKRYWRNELEKDGNMEMRRSRKLEQIENSPFKIPKNYMMNVCSLSLMQ